MKKDLAVISKAKELSALIFEITDKSPKKYRFSLVSRMQNLSLDIISRLYSANETYIDTKIVSDMSRTIDYTRSIKKFTSEEERIHYLDKLFELKLFRAIKTEEQKEKRVGYSYEAMSKLNELDWLITLAAKMQCITPKQQQRLAMLLYELRKLIGGFIKSDKKRFDNRN